MPGAARRLHVDDELSWIGAREEGNAEEWRERQAEHKAAHDDGNRHLGTLQSLLDRLVVLGEDVVVSPVERRQHALQPSAFMFALGFAAVF